MLGIQPSTASTSDSALIIIDAQNEYANGLLKVTNVDQSRIAIASLLRKYRDAKAPVIHVVHEVPEGAPVFTPGTALAAEFDELKPLEGESVVTKNVLTGYMAHVCVSTTARQGHERGWDVIVAEDCVGDRDIPGAKGDELTKTVMAELSDFFASIVNSGSIS